MSKNKSLVESEASYKEKIVCLDNLGLIIWDKVKKFTKYGEA